MSCRPGDLPFALRDPARADELSLALDPEDRLARGIVRLAGLGGSSAGSPAVILGGARWLVPRLERLGVTATAGADDPVGGALPAGVFDAVVGGWGVLRGTEAPELAACERLLRPGGRIVVLHDYGRDEVAPLLGTDRPEIASWSRHGGPYLRGGWKLRVLHARIAVAGPSALAALLAGEVDPGEVRGPGIHWKVAAYHRTAAGRGA
jgi:hypothetical protein